MYETYLVIHTNGESTLCVIEKDFATEKDLKNRFGESCTIERVGKTTSVAFYSKSAMVSIGNSIEV